MKTVYSILFLFLSLFIHSQNSSEIKQVIKDVNSEKQVIILKDLMSDWSIETIENFSSENNLPKKLSDLKLKETVSIEENNKKYVYKLLNESNQKEFRVSYIYLDGSQLSKSEIDSTRALIIKKFHSGTPFSDLADDYNMDSNSKKGDLGWFEEGKMVKEFEKAIKNYKKNDIFNVDVETRNWYYVVLKTHQDRNNLKKLFLRVEVKE